MSKMSNEAIRAAESRSLDNADEVAWLRHEVARLEGIITQAALLLDEGDPPKMFEELEDLLREDDLDEDADDLRELAATLGRARALLVAACP